MKRLADPGDASRSGLVRNGRNLTHLLLAATATNAEHWPRASAQSTSTPDV